MSKKESNISAEIIIWMSENYQALPTRLNSGMAYQGEYDRKEKVLKNLRHVALCPEGTADLMFLMKNGIVLFVETKTSTGNQRKSQEKWEIAVRKKNHHYVLARSVDDVKKYIEENIKI